MKESLSQMTNFQVVGMIGRIMNSGHPWNATTEILQDSMDLLHQVVRDHGENTGNRLKSVELVQKCVAQNMLHTKMMLDMSGGNQEVEQPKVILLLPPNGSEMSSEDGA
jgi:hypothetical protein